MATKKIKAPSLPQKPREPTPPREPSRRISDFTTEYTSLDNDGQLIYTSGGGLELPYPIEEISSVSIEGGSYSSYFLKVVLKKPREMSDKEYSQALNTYQRQLKKYEVDYDKYLDKLTKYETQYEEFLVRKKAYLEQESKAVDKELSKLNE